MSKQDHLDANLRRLLASRNADMKLPADKKQHILKTLLSDSSDHAIHSRPKPTSLRWAKYAAAVLLIAAVLVAAVLINRSADKDQPPTGLIDTPTANDDTEQNTDDIELAAALERITRFYENNDIDALVQTLTEGRFAAKALAAGYLGEIGDARALNDLNDLYTETKEMLSEDPQANPFKAAIDAINARLAQSVANDNAPLEPATDNTATSIVYEGTVTDEQGRPLNAVVVRSQLYWRGSYLWTPQQHKQTDASVLSDSSGRYRMQLKRLVAIQGPRRMLIFEHPQYALGFTTYSYADIRLFRPAKISGRVVDEDGDPIAGVSVTANPARDPRCQTMGSECYITAVTNSNGQFTIEKLIDGARAHITALKEGYERYMTPEYGSSDRHVARAGTENMLIKLKPGGVLRGRLMLQGNPYAREGITVKACTTGSSTVGLGLTNEKGEFEILGLAANRSSTVMIDNGVFGDTGLVARPLENVRLQAGEQWDVELQLSKGQPVTIEVVDEATARPVENHFVMVGIFDPNRASGKPVNVRIASARTDFSGKCVFHLPANHYRARVDTWTEGRTRDLEEYFVVDDGDSDKTVKIAVNAGRRVRGTLFDNDGKPIEGRVFITGKGSNSAVSDKLGRFALTIGPSGDDETEHMCVAFDSARSLGRLLHLSPQEDCEQLEILLEPVVTISGRMIDTKGNGISLASPRLYYADPNGKWHAISGISDMSPRVDPSGNFIFPQLPIGLPMAVGMGVQVPLGILKPGQAVDAGSIIVPDKTIASLLKAKERDQQKLAGTLAGFVTDEQGQPISGVHVDIQFDGKRFHDYTDTEGWYQLTGLPEGQQGTISVDASDFRSAEYDVVCDGNTFDIQLSKTQR